MAPIKEAGLSSKEKSLKHSRGRNFEWIFIKLYTHVILIKIQILCENKLCGINRSVDFIKIQIKFVNELCGANRSGNTFLQRKYYNPL